MGVGERAKGLTLRAVQSAARVGSGEGEGLKVGAELKRRAGGKGANRMDSRRRRRILLKYVKTVIKIEKSREKF